MARTAYRTLIISAAFALASWALVAGAPVLAAAPAEQAGPQLPTPEYKPLPVGTKVTYDTWGYTVTKTEGFDITFKTTAGNWKHYYAVFGKHGDNVYLSGEWGSTGQDWESGLDAESKAALETIWPLKVGKKVKLNSEESRGGYSNFPTSRPWTVALEVVRAEVLELNGVLYSTYVIEEHAVTEGGTSATLPGGPEGYSETKWYNPESGLVLKSVKEMTLGPKKGEREEYSLVRVRFPQGTKTSVLAGTRIPAGDGAGPDPRLTAEIARLTQEAEERRKAEEEARLKAEAERQRKAKVASRTPAPASDLQRQIAVLKQLRDGGLITEQQFMARQKDLLDRFVGVPKTATARLTALKSPQAALEAKLAKYRDIEFGRYHALVIGIGNYKHLPRLKTAVNDAKAVADVLRQDYGFTVKLLLDPARDDIVDTLDEYRAALGQADNLLIYYAGHGWLDEESNRGYWLAADARPNRRSKWVSNATITDTLKTLQAKHVMVVADSCYSGTLIRGAPVGLRSGNYWRRMAKKRARVALTSGGLEPVADIGGGGHSPFATAFIGALKGNAAVMDGTTLFNEVRRPVMLSADQTPEYSDVRRAGHDGGDFLFVRRR